MLKKLLISIIFLLLVAYVAIGYFFSNMLLQPHQSDFTSVQRRTIARTGFDYENVYARMGTPKDVAIQTSEDTKLKGWYFQKPNAPCAIVFAHGWGSNRTGSLKYAPLFEDCTCDLLFYDHRAHNESGGNYATGGVLEARDLLEVTDWLQDQNGLTDEATAWVGVSWGAATVLQAGGQSQRSMAFILADSPFQDWHTATTERADKWFGTWTRMFTPILKVLVRLRAGTSYDNASCISYASQIKAPVFLIHSEGDRDTGSHQSVNINKVLPQPKVFHHTQWGSDHTKDITDHTSKYKSLFDNFKAQYAGNWPGC